MWRQDGRILLPGRNYIGSNRWSFGLEFVEFVGQEPNNSVYLAPIGWDITRKTVLTTKPYARFVVKTTQLVVFLNVPQKRNKVIRFADFLQRNKFTNQNLSASFTLFLITIYYEWKFKARVISIILWITFPVRKELPARPVRRAMDLGQTK